MSDIKLNVWKYGVVPELPDGSSVLLGGADNMPTGATYVGIPCGWMTPGNRWYRVLSIGPPEIEPRERWRRARKSDIRPGGVRCRVRDTDRDQWNDAVLINYIGSGDVGHWIALESGYPGVRWLCCEVPAEPVDLRLPDGWRVDTDEKQGDTYLVHVSRGEHAKPGFLRLHYREETRETCVRAINAAVDAMEASNG